MLLRKELIEKNEEKYKPMLEQVNIPDFTKCVAAMANISITDVNDDVICRYLSAWAKNKYDFFVMFGNKLSVDYKMAYEEESNDIDSQDYFLNEIETRFPAYIPWLRAIFDCSYAYKYNKICDDRNVMRTLAQYIEKYLGRDYNDFAGQKITTFLQRELDAPEELLTEIAKVWENRKFEGYITASIDPVDIMLASENPYKWRSCYCLDGGGHSDGCLAAVLDSSSIITYSWNRQGKFKLLGEYDLKNIKYKQKRAFIEFNPERTLMHLNKIYPHKKFSDEFELAWIKTTTQFLNKKIEKMDKEHSLSIIRKYLYGYDEDRFGSSLYYTSDYTNNWTYISYYDVEIECPDGCGDMLPGTDNDEYEWEGDSLIAEEFTEQYEEEYYCDIIHNYCDNYNDEDGCCECRYYREYYAKCENQPDLDCTNPDVEYIDETKYGDFIERYDEEHCKGCPLARLHCHKEKKKEEKTSFTVYEISLDHPNESTWL